MFFPFFLTNRPTDFLRLTSLIWPLDPTLWTLSLKPLWFVDADDAEACALLLTLFVLDSFIVIGIDAAKSVAAPRLSIISRAL